MAGFRVHRGSDGVIYLAGELDMATADRFSEDALANLDGQPDVVLDLADLRFIDSTGIKSILGLAKHVQPKRVVLRAPDPGVARILDVVAIETFGLVIEGSDVD